MNLRLILLERLLVPRVRLRMLEELARVTAGGFGAAVPEWVGGTFNARLTEYARFTAHEARLLIAAGDRAATEAVKGRLRSGARRLGDRLRVAVGLSTAEDAFAALQMLYRQIEVEVGGGPLGEVTVGRCFFADYYDGFVCRVIEALDQGLVSGLFGGASLEFSERLSEGGPRCRACLQPGSSSEWSGS